MELKENPICKNILLKTLLTMKEQNLKFNPSNSTYKIFEDLKYKQTLIEYKLLHEELQKNPKCLETMEKILFMDNMITIIKAKQNNDII